MLPRPLRLRRRKDVKRVMHTGRRIRTQYAIIYVTRVSVPQSRIACVVGRRVHSSAVRRHRIQRWLREIARSTIADMSTPYDMVWVALPGIANVKTKMQLEGSIKSRLLKLTRES